MPDPTPTDALTRRTVVVGGCAGALALCLGGCATYDADGPVDSSGAAGAGGPSTVPVGDVPVGGGVVLAAQKVVVTQPTACTFAAFGATCPHQGCTVNKVADGTIDCPCHGSKFTIADGSVVEGPAARGLDRRQASVADGTVRVT